MTALHETVMRRPGIIIDVCDKLAHMQRALFQAISPRSTAFVHAEYQSIIITGE
jgi:hypothetical protein